MPIEVKKLTHCYHKGSSLETLALDDLSLVINEGCWLCVVGHTGSGKSTFAQHLNAIMRPTSGSVSVDGLVVSSDKTKADLRPIRQAVGLVFQYPEQQLFEETVRAEIAFGPRNWGVPEEEIDELVQESMELVGLAPSYLNRNPFSLSGGEKRRVAIASVLASRPKYLVLDEPTAGLDGAGRKQLLELLQAIHRHGTAIVQVTHDLDIAFSCADRILVLEHGKACIWDEPPVVARWLHHHPVKGLVLPELVKLALELESRGVTVPLTSNEEDLFKALKENRQ